MVIDKIENKKTDLQDEKKRREFTGTVVSDKMHKTIIVRVERVYSRADLGKVVRTSKRYKVHDENEQAKVADTVKIYEGRPKSKTKYMYLAEIVSSATAVQLMENKGG